MKPIVLFFILLFPLAAQDLVWNQAHEQTLQKSISNVGSTLSQKTILVGRLGIARTRVAIALNDKGLLLAPIIPGIDKSDSPYILYQPDGSRINLTTIHENKRRAIAILQTPPSHQPPQYASPANLTDHTLLIPTCAPLASLDEKITLTIDHLKVTPKEEARSVQINHNCYLPGSPVLDLSGNLIGITLISRPTYTPVLLIPTLISEIAELRDNLPEVSTPKNLNTPPAPLLDEEEEKESRKKTAQLTTARATHLFSRLPAPLPCVRITHKNSPQTHSLTGTIIRKDGLILTKASELGPDLVVTYDGKTFPAILLSTDEESDLALVSISASNLPTVNWSDSPPTSSSILITPILLDPEEQATETSKLTSSGVFSQSLLPNTPTIQSSSQTTSLGIITEQADNNLTIAAIVPETPASKADLKIGDRIISLDKTTVTKRTDLTSILKSKKVGDQVTLKFSRSDEEKEATFELTSPLIIPPTTGIDITRISAFTPLVPSVRRAPFPTTLVHSTTINAWDCGSPVFDLEGKAVGLNIASVARSRTLALTTTEIKLALERLLKKTRAF